MNRAGGRYARKPGVIETGLDDELILLDPASQEMFSLNETGRLVWRILPDHGVDEVIDQLVELFDVAREQAESDVRDLVAKLVEADLILPADDAGE